MKTPVQILTRARDLVAGGRWAQTSSECALAAIDAVGPWHDSMPERYLWLAIKDITGVKWRISEWNDARGRTRDEVVAAFDRAIELARAEEQLGLWGAT